MARIGPGDVTLTMADLRVVARYAAESAEEVHPLFEETHPDDRRPLANATQVGHILRAAAYAARSAELAAGDARDVGDRHIEHARERATPVLIDVLRRYPPAPTGNSRVAQLMKTLDSSLRSP